jgi:hypothetical protein
VKWFGNPTTQVVRDAMAAGVLGAITTPDQRNVWPTGVPWIADNGCFGKGYPGDEAWLAWLASRTPARDNCVFATAPDVVGDAAATLARSAPFLPRIRELGYRAALVAQDGLEDLVVPWDTFDVLFVGGSTAWKLGTDASQLVAEARARGKGIHFGRVNSLKRLRYAVAIGGPDVTCDGTFLAFAPAENLGRFRVWLDELARVPVDTLLV